MIRALTPGMRLMLPSGNVVRLVVKYPGGEWLCEYQAFARARGEVVFSGAWLRRVGQRV